MHRVRLVGSPPRWWPAHRGAAAQAPTGQEARDGTRRRPRDGSARDRAGARRAREAGVAHRHRARPAGGTPAKAAFGRVPARPVHRPRGRPDLLLGALGLPGASSPWSRCSASSARASRRPTRCSTSCGSSARARWPTSSRADRPIVNVAGRRAGPWSSASAGALWSASGYVGAFGRAMNRVYQVDEGRPVWKLRPVVLLITLGLVVMAALVLVGLVVSGPVATAIGEAVGLGDQASTVWSIVKWPVMLGIVVVMVAVLYYATPNVKQPKFRWVSVGAAVAILHLGARVGRLRLLRVATSARTTRPTARSPASSSSCCGSGSPTSRCSFGAEIDAELERARELQAGIEAEQTAPAAAARHAATPTRPRRSWSRRSPRAAGCGSRPTAGVTDAGNGYAARAWRRDSRRARRRHPELEPLPSERGRATGPRRRA